MRRFWITGFAAILSVCVLASCLAYSGALRLSALGIPHLDFFAHLVFMGLLAFFADGLFAHRAMARALPLGPVLVLAAAATDEVLQRFSANRSSSWSDFVADVVGVTVAAVLASRVARGVTARRDRAPAG